MCGFDDTVQEKASTDENEIMCCYYGHCKGRSVKGINLSDALYHSGDVPIPVAFERMRKAKRAAELQNGLIPSGTQVRSMIATCVANTITTAMS